MHLLESLVMFANLGDIISVTPSKELQIHVDGDFGRSVPADGGLVADAIAAMAAAGAQISPVNLRLMKNIPVGGGLGGGSSDAVTAAKVLNGIADQPMAEDALLDCIKVLGADMRVCFLGTSTFVAGIGEIMRPLPDLPKLNAVLANAGTEVSTADVFRRFDRSDGLPDEEIGFAELSEVRGSQKLLHLLSNSRNDLEETAVAIEPGIATALEALKSTAGCRIARMTGSGGTVFGLFETAEAAEMAARSILAAEPHWWVIATELGDLNR